ncbi:MAG: hydroxysqualene dehydroxylase HpnE [Castellaniella sp.]|nr:hydroxysqualene dehydroxylase HpnE [Castellaniella sp.]
MKTAVVGAGWAGLAAAVRLHQTDHRVHIYEAAPQAGGRARPIDPPALGQSIDNGQHLLLGAYRETLGLMRSLRVDPEDVCHAQPLALQSADRQLRLRFWPLPAPAHRLGALIGGRGLDGWHGRRHLLRVLCALDPDAIDPWTTVAHWLRQLDCPPGLLRRLWGPLCLAATNTDIARAQAQLFARVLRDSLGHDAQASRLYIPRSRLHDLWPAQACALLGDHVRFRRVHALSPEPDGRWSIDGESYDHVILAVPPGEARRLISPLPRAAQYLDAWSVPQHAAIGTLTLRLSQPWDSGHAMALLWDDPDREAWGQWLFDRSATARSPADRRLVHVVVSAADRYADRSTADIATGILSQIRTQVARPLPSIEAQALVTEKRATFDAVPGLRRPTTITPWPGLLLAGDWTDTGYPAVLEGAVRSGLRAADRLMR